MQGLHALIAAASVLLTAPALAQTQQEQSPAGTTYSADSACLKRLSEAVPGFESRLSAADSRDLRQLLRPALILANRGNEVACQAILAEIERIGSRAQGQELSAEQRAAQITGAREVGPGAAIRVQELIDSDVVTRDGDEVGDVQDLLIVPGSENPVYVLVDRGGWLSLGSEVVAVPMTSLRVTEGGDLVIGGTRDQFDQAPALEGEGVADDARLAADQYWADIDR